MAEIQNIPLNEKLRDSNPKINQNFQNLNSDIGRVDEKINDHIDSTSAHNADNITYTGAVPGNDVKEALDNVNERISEIVAQSGNDITEIVDARGGYTVLADRLDSSDAVLKEKVNKGDIFLNIKDYGAKGDGIADDTLFIQNAINDCHSKGGGTVFFPSGIYLGGDIILKSRVSLYAFPSTSFYSVENDGVVVLRAKNSSTCIIDTSSADGFAINNLYFDGVNKTIDGVSSGGDTGQIHGCKFSRCKVGIGGFKVHYITATSIWNCFFKDNVTGIDNIIDSKIDNNYFYENDIGMALSAGSNALIITNNKFEWNTNTGLNAYQCKNLVISNNIFDRNGESGLLLDSCDTASITGNVFMRNGATTTNTIRQNHILLAGCKKLTFVGNLTKKAEINDDGSGIMTPRSCVYVTDSADVYFNGDDLTGYTTVLLEEGANNANFFRLGCIGLMKRGIFQASGNGTNKVFRIPHGFGRFPALVTVQASSNDAASSFYFVTEEQDIVVNYLTAPPSGTNNVLLRWVTEG